MTTNSRGLGLWILCWTCRVLTDLGCDEFFLGDDYNAKDQVWLHSGGKQHLVCLAVPHHVLEHLLEHQLQEEQLQQGLIVVNVASQDPGGFRACDPQGDDLRLVRLPHYLQIKLLDFTFRDWTTVNRVYVKPDLIKQAYKHAQALQMSIPSIFRQAMLWYMRHFREIASPQCHEVLIWVATFEYPQKTRTRFDTSHFTASAMR